MAGLRPLHLRKSWRVLHTVPSMKGAVCAPSMHAILETAAGIPKVRQRETRPYQRMNENFQVPQSRR